MERPRPLAGEFGRAGRDRLAVHRQGRADGQGALELGTRGNTMVTSVACHPADDIVAIGYADGMVLAARFADRKEVLLRRAGKGAITGLGWDREGRRAAFGAETGECGVIDISA